MFKLFKKLKMNMISEIVSSIIPDIKFNLSIDFSFLDIDNINIDKKYVDLLMKKIEKLNLESCINFMTNDVRIKIIERFKQFLNNIILLYVSFTGVLFNYHSIPANVRIGRAPPKLL